LKLGQRLIQKNMDLEPGFHVLLSEVLFLVLWGQNATSEDPGIYIAVFFALYNWVVVSNTFDVHPNWRN